jgi:hypothetical protein
MASVASVPAGAQADQVVVLALPESKMVVAPVPLEYTAVARADTLKMVTQLGNGQWPAVVVLFVLYGDLVDHFLTMRLMYNNFSSNLDNSYGIKTS